MFNYPLLAGDPRTALAKPGSIVLSEALAKKYFGDADPMGRMMKWDNAMDVQVTGILGEWGPERVDNRYEGAITARQALVASKNAATVRLGMMTGLDHVVPLAKLAGIDSPLRPYPATFLGSSEVTLMEMTLANTIFPNGGSRPEVERRTGGTASLGVTSGGYTEIVSRPCAPSELPGVTSTLSVDVFVPAQQPNPWWIGSLQAFVSCPASNVNDAYLGQADLTHLFRDEFNTITFPGLPSYVTAALAGTGSCSLKLALNTPTGAGEYLLDNLAFR
jgi:hypothetical protein